MIVDEDGQSAKSPAITLNVGQGATSIPREIRGSAGIPWRILLYVLVCLAIIGMLIYLFRRMRQGGSTRGGQNLGGWRKRAKIARAERKKAPIQTPRVENVRPIPTPDPLPDASSAYTSPYSRPTQAVGSDGMPKIEVLEARSSIPTIVPVNRTEFLIGRSPTVDLALTEDATVSRIHATIVEDNGIYRIYDEQSTSGTYVNDREVPEYGLQLSSGDEIHIGAVHLRFRL
ncbi:MAG TPA: FHA domain-containing protein [Anaerolineae bacterium]|nr:FHA domain-containing protein [Anaerolineae bacterium]